MQIRWTPNTSASAMHFAEMVARFPAQVTDERVRGLLVGYSRTLRTLFSESGIETDGFWNSLHISAVEIDSNHELSRATLRRCGCYSDEGSVGNIAGAITDIEAVFQQLHPQYAEQVLLRIRPLQEGWLGYGAGLMAHLGRLTTKSLIPEHARVVPLQPIVGGFGWAHREANLVRIEAVLTNSIAEIPEVVRLAWLLSQLRLDELDLGELFGSYLLDRLAPLAMLPAVLASAQVIELSACTEDNLALAIEHWHIPFPSQLDLHKELVPTVIDWWETYLTTKPDWPVAMHALAKMLSIV
jgi:hypothetical protein